MKMRARGGVRESGETGVQESLSQLSYAHFRCFLWHLLLLLLLLLLFGSASVGEAAASPSGFSLPPAFSFPVLRSPSSIPTSALAAGPVYFIFGTFRSLFAARTSFALFAVSFLSFSIHFRSEHRTRTVVVRSHLIYLTDLYSLNTKYFAAKIFLSLPARGVGKK